MQRNIITGILGVAIISLMTVALATAAWPDHALAGSAHRLHGGFGHHGGDACAHLNSKHSRLLSAYLEIALELNDAQSRELTSLMAVLDEWRASAEASCTSLAVETLPEALAQLKVMLRDAERAIELLQPQLDSFYATLTVEQQATLNGLIRHHHGV